MGEANRWIKRGPLAAIALMAAAATPLSAEAQTNTGRDYSPELSLDNGPGVIHSYRDWYSVEGINTAKEEALEESIAAQEGLTQNTIEVAGGRYDAVVDAPGALRVIARDETIPEGYVSYRRQGTSAATNRFWRVMDKIRGIHNPSE